MKMKNISSRVLRFSRVVTAAMTVFLISISISLYKSKTSPVTWLTVGVLAFVVILVNGLLYHMLKKRPDSEHLLTLKQVHHSLSWNLIYGALCRVLHTINSQWYDRPHSVSPINAFINTLWFSSLSSSQKIF